jgi:hypothetical protein
LIVLAVPGSVVVPFPSNDVKITRNSSGKMNVKNADAGFRQNALFVNRNCRAMSRVTTFLLLRR